MPDNSKSDTYFNTMENMLNTTPAKIMMAAGVALAVLYVAGFFFEVGATTVVSYKKLHRATKL